MMALHVPPPPPPHHGQAASGLLSKDAALVPKNRRDGQPLISSVTGSWAPVLAGPQPLSQMDQLEHVPRRRAHRPPSVLTSAMRPQTGRRSVCDSSANGTNETVVLDKGGIQRAGGPAVWDPTFARPAPPPQPALMRGSSTEGAVGLCPVTHPQPTECSGG